MGHCSRRWLKEKPRDGAPVGPGCPPPKTIVERVPPTNQPSFGVVATAATAVAGRLREGPDGNLDPGMSQTAYIASWGPGGPDLA